MTKENLYLCYLLSKWGRQDDKFMAVFDIKITDKNISFHRGLTGFHGYSDSRIMNLKRIKKEIVIAHNTEPHDWDDFLFYIQQAGVPYNFIKIKDQPIAVDGFAYVKYDREKKYFITNKRNNDSQLNFTSIKLTNDEWFKLAKMKDGQGFYKEKIT